MHPGLLSTLRRLACMQPRHPWPVLMRRCDYLEHAVLLCLRIVQSCRCVMCHGASACPPRPHRVTLSRYLTRCHVTGCG
jgi:hypothetical protein